jgi:hypothetical protein
LPWNSAAGSGTSVTIVDLRLRIGIERLWIDGLQVGRPAA